MKIINVRGLAANLAGVVYCGRECAGWKGSPLANPYRIGEDGDREAVIEKYRMWLWCRLQEGSPAVLKALEELSEDSVLGCWCGDRPCHCRVIEAAWRWLQSQK